jgi:hypothetical protein
MTIAQWIKEVREMDDKELKNLVQALDTLKQWDSFRKEFQWTGIFSLREIVETEIRNRRRELVDKLAAEA